MKAALPAAREALAEIMEPKDSQHPERPSPPSAPPGGVAEMREAAAQEAGVGEEEIVETLQSVPQMCLVPHTGTGPYTHLGCLMVPDHYAMARAVLARLREGK